MLACYHFEQIIIIYDKNQILKSVLEADRSGIKCHIDFFSAVFQAFLWKFTVQIWTGLSESWVTVVTITKQWNACLIILHNVCAVHWGISLSTPGGYHEHTREYHDECGDIIVHWGMFGGCSVHWGFHTNSVVFPMTLPHIYHDISHCTHDTLPVYGTSPQCTAHPPVYCTDIMECTNGKMLFSSCDSNHMCFVYV